MEKSQRIKFVAGLSEVEQNLFLNGWHFTARRAQLPPDGTEWRTWLYLAGRGAGKTRAASEAVLDAVEHHGCRRVALVSRSSADCRDVQVEGESGLLACGLRRGLELRYEPSKRRVTWPGKWAPIATTYSADEPNLLRGPQHDFAWADEAASYRRVEAIDHLRLGLRLGKAPRLIITTTPKPRRFLRALMKEPTTVVTRGSTYDNAVNLAPEYIALLKQRYEGTTMGRQEVYAELLDQAPNAIFTRKAIDDARVTEAPELRRVVVAIDPAVSDGDEADESGIVVVGEFSGHFYILEDASCRGMPDQIIKLAHSLYHKYRADTVVVEKNNGGETWRVISNQLDLSVPITLVHASRGKYTRAEPVSARFEQGKCHMVGTGFSDLEDQLCSFEPMTPESTLNDRLDALVWGVHELDYKAQPDIELDLAINHVGKGLSWMS